MKINLKHKTIININKKNKNTIKKDNMFTIERHVKKESKICKYCGEHGCYCGK